LRYNGTAEAVPFPSLFFFEFILPEAILPEINSAQACSFAKLIFCTQAGIAVLFISGPGW
jgi:hypothetical protein